MSYTQEQIDQLTESLNKFGAEEVPRGLIQDFGEKSVMMKVTEHMIQHGNVPPTVDGIKLTVQAFEKAGHKIYYAKHEWNYVQEFQQLSPDAQQKFNDFWNTKWITGQLVTGSSKEGYENATKFLVWMHGREMNKSYLEMAFSNLSAKGQLHFISSSYKPSALAEKSQHEPGKFWNDSRVEQRKWELEEAQRKALAEKIRDNPAAAADAEWESMWNRLQGNSYAQTSRAKAILILKNDGSPDYKAMFNAALAMMDESQRQPLDRYSYDAPRRT
jgi:hypothetical protein